MIAFGLLRICAVVNERSHATALDALDRQPLVLCRAAVVVGEFRAEKERSGEANETCLPAQVSGAGEVRAFGCAGFGEHGRSVLPATVATEAAGHFSDAELRFEAISIGGPSSAGANAAVLPTGLDFMLAPWSLARRYRLHFPARVLGPRDRLEMLRVHAWSVAAQVINGQIVGNVAVSADIGIAMGKPHLPILAVPAIACVGDITLPDVAWSRMSAVFDRYPGIERKLLPDQIAGDGH